MSGKVIDIFHQLVDFEVPVESAELDWDSAASVSATWNRYFQEFRDRCFRGSTEEVFLLLRAEPKSIQRLLVLQVLLRFVQAVTSTGKLEL